MQESTGESESMLTVYGTDVAVKVLPPFKMDQLDTFSAYLIMLNAKVYELKIDQQLAHCHFQIHTRTHTHTHITWPYIY